MRVVVVHNAYQHLGGEDSVVDSEVALLRRFGHDVETYRRTNDDISSIGAFSLARQTLWSKRTETDLSDLVSRFRPEVIHVHNTFPLVSPSVYWVAARLQVPVVQTLHNFRLMCLNALYLRDGQVCEDCRGSVPWRGVVRRCYRDSPAASVVLAGMLVFHRSLGTYRRKIARYIALNKFCRDKFIEGGLPEDRIAIKPNFIDAPSPEEIERREMLFVGRLSKEKGIDVLVRAAQSISGGAVRVAGSGPLSGLLDGSKGITPLGNLSATQVRREMERALSLVVPSIWYENFPRTIVEAFAAGLPVIASRIGALADIVTEGQTGLLFNPGDAEDLASKMAWAQAHPAEMAAMGVRARAQYEREFSAEVNHRMLLNIYQEAIHVGS